MSEVNTVVHTEPGGEDDVDTGDHVDGDVPEVEGPDHVDECEHDAGHHHQTEVEVAEHDQGHHAHRQQGQGQVPPELQGDDGVSLPGLVDLNTRHIIHHTAPLSPVGEALKVFPSYLSFGKYMDLSSINPSSH